MQLVLNLTNVKELARRDVHQQTIGLMMFASLQQVHGHWDIQLQLNVLEASTLDSVKGIIQHKSHCQFENTRALTGFDVKNGI